MKLWKRKNKNGKEIINFHPQQMSEACIEKLKSGFNPKTGEKLTARQKAWASGYLQRGSDSVAAYNSKSKANKRKEQEQFYNDLWGQKRN